MIKPTETITLQIGRADERIVRMNYPVHNLEDSPYIVLQSYKDGEKSMESRLNLSKTEIQRIPLDRGSCLNYTGLLSEAVSYDVCIDEED